MSHTRISELRVDDHRRVHLVKWPTERGKRDQCRSLGVPTLLLVDPGAPPPICGDAREDWVRTPVSKVDLDARVHGLRARTAGSHLPEIDPIGVVRFDSISVAVSPTEADLLRVLVDRFGQVVARDNLLDRLSDRPADSRRNALNLHVMRIRRRIQPLDLTIRTVWGVGYALERAGTGQRRPPQRTDSRTPRARSSTSAHTLSTPDSAAVTKAEPTITPSAKPAIRPA